MRIGLHISGLRIVMLLIAAYPVHAQEPPPAGVFSQKECVQCHEQNNRHLVDDWRASRHVSADGQKSADCVSCHGTRHDGSLSRSRQNRTCNGCHGGESGAAAHSYSTSKHGILYRLEAPSDDDAKSHVTSNYRAPGCAYCHYPAGDHRHGKQLSGKEDALGAISTSMSQSMRWICNGCHSPRYVRELEENGKQMWQIGEMKLREAGELLDVARKTFSPEQLGSMETLYSEMREETMKALKFGIAHQSPDYQWWHGQPALDGKLLRIKGALTRLMRLRELQQQDGAK